MTTARKLYRVAQPMRIQARKGSQAEKTYYLNSALPGGAWPRPKAIAPGIDPAPLDDLMFHGGKTVPQMEFQNVYLGETTDYPAGDIDSIDAAISRAMRDRKLNNVISQYFLGSSMSCDVRSSFVVEEPKVQVIDEPDVQAKIAELFDAGRLGKSDLQTTIFNLVLPPGTELRLGESSSFQGLGGYHGSLHVQRGGKRITLYYSANVYSQMITSARENGIVVFDRPWKNVVATLYHELNEFRTDADVNDAIQTGSNDFLGWMSRFGQECGDQPIATAAALSQVFKEVTVAGSTRRSPIQFMFSNAVHGAEGPIDQPHATLSASARRAAARVRQAGPPAIVFGPPPRRREGREGRGGSAVAGRAQRTVEFDR